MNQPIDPTPGPPPFPLGHPVEPRSLAGIRELISLLRELVDRLEDRIEQLEHPPRGG
jgi:hypothetical protein